MEIVTKKKTFIKENKNLVIQLKKKKENLGWLELIIRHTFGVIAGYSDYLSKYKVE